MKISNDSLIPFDRLLVYSTYRDKLLELVPYMPNITWVKVRSQRHEGHITYSINDWRGGGDIPGAARAILSEDLLAWSEHHTWNEEEFTQDWYIKTHAFSEAVQCAGTTRFLKDNGSTKVETRGELSIDPSQIKGFPSFMVGGIAHVVEEFLASKIPPNLVQMSEGVSSYLSKNS
jgi:hypothetical protein